MTRRLPPPARRPTRLVHVTTSPLALMFLRGQVGSMRERGFEVHAIASPGERLERFGAEEGVTVHAIDMPRRITPHRDVVAVWRLARVLRRLRPAIVHAHTPKGGLLGMIAATACRVPVRVYHIHGFPYMTASGRRRLLLKSTERIACRLAHRVLCVSPSLRDVAIADGICPPDEIAVLAGGSINGIDTGGRFNPDRFDSASRNRRRDSLGLPRDARVIGFVGRIVRDKGIHELAAAWSRLRDQHPDIHLVLAGEVEPQDPVDPAVLRLLRGDHRVHFLGMIDEIDELYSVVDVVALPTYREGLGNILLEAAAMRLPVVATTIPGCIDAVRDGETGTLVPPRDAGALQRALAAYIEDEDLRRRHGEAGRAWVMDQFRQEVIWDAVYREYERLLRDHGVEPPRRWGEPGRA